MKENKTPRWKLWSLSAARSSKGISSKKPCKIIALSVFGLLVVVMLLGPGNVKDLPEVNDGKTRSHGKTVAPNSVAKSMWNSVSTPAKIVSQRDKSFSFLPKVITLDDQLQKWWQKNPEVRAGRPKVLLVSGSQPTPCEDPVESHMYLRSGKNKLHYARMHDLQMFYSLVEPQEGFVGAWNKLAILRMQMVAHPEAEWLWWMDSDTVILDMEFQLPFLKYEGYNLILYGDERKVLEEHDWKGLSTANFLIRNCQWSLDLLDAWGSMGVLRHRKEVGKFLSDSLHERPEGMEADDQSALVYLLATEQVIWSPKTCLENDIFFTGDWISVTEKLEEMEQYNHGDPRWPVSINFAGCARCSGSQGVWPRDQWQREMERAMDFADNQVYRKYGYQMPGLGIHEAVPVPGHVVKGVVTSPDVSRDDWLGFPFHKLPGPRVENWDSQREAWFQDNPDVKRVTEHGLLKTMLVTGSSVGPCTNPVGSHGLLQGLKNKVDYARFHDMPIYYGMLDFDKKMDYWWTKIPTIRVLMLHHPDVEWFWWCDADAAVTDMVFVPPYERFVGQNLVMYGDYGLLANRDWIAVNAGIYLIRNCQWTLDFFDIWASLGVEEWIVESGRRASKVLVGREEGIDADDQSALLYMLTTEDEKRWSPQIRLEREFTMSGYWKVLAPTFEKMDPINKGTGGIHWPWITHFAGCQPCGDRRGNFEVEECRSQLNRAFDFADNQVLEQYGLVHTSLGNPYVERKKTLSSSSRRR